MPEKSQVLTVLYEAEGVERGGARGGNSGHQSIYRETTHRGAEQVSGRCHPQLSHCPEQFAECISQASVSQTLLPREEL